MKACKRINYLDYIKGFTLILVILGHIYIPTNPIKIWLCSFHVPLFFIVSGFLSNNKNIDIKTTIIKKFKSLMIPYILFGLVFFIFKAKFNLAINLTIDNYILSLLTTSNLGALWFLPTLFIIEVIFSILNRSKLHDFIKIAIIVVLFLIGLNGNNYYINPYIIVLYRSLVGFGFFMLGNYAFKYIKKIEVSYLIIFLIFLLSINLSLKNECVDLWGLVFNNKVLYVISSLVGSLVIVLFFKKISDKFENIKLLNYIALNSLIIMSTHQIVLDIINKMTGDWSYSTIIGFIVCMIIIIIEIPIIYLINKYLPFMIGRFKKKLD